MGDLYQRVTTIGNLSTDAGTGIICGAETLLSLLERVAKGEVEPELYMRQLMAVPGNDDGSEFNPGGQYAGFVVFQTGGDGEFPVRATTLVNSRFGPMFQVRVDLLETLDSPPDT